MTIPIRRVFNAAVVEAEIHRPLPLRLVYIDSVNRIRLVSDREDYVAPAPSLAGDHLVGQDAIALLAPKYRAIVRRVFTAVRLDGIERAVRTRVSHGDIELARIEPMLPGQLKVGVYRCDLADGGLRSVCAECYHRRVCPDAIPCSGDGLRAENVDAATELAEKST
jgi:hypothetical protein